jgi:hypothetical protein
VARKHSPDGVRDAVLFEIAKDAAGRRAMKVCMQPAGGVAFTAGSYTELAYLSGIGTDPVPVYAKWTTSTTLEIHYTQAEAVHLYQSIFYIFRS